MAVAFAATGVFLVFSIFASVQAAVNTAIPAPTNLTATSVSTSQVNLQWTASVYTKRTDMVAGYFVYRSGEKIASVSVSTTLYADTGLTAGTAYSYTVAAYDLSGDTSVMSEPATAVTAGGGASGTLTGKIQIAASANFIRDPSGAACQNE